MYCHGTTFKTLNGLSKANSGVLDPENWTNGTTLALAVMLVPGEITLSTKNSAIPTMELQLLWWRWLTSSILTMLSQISGTTKSPQTKEPVTTETPPDKIDWRNL